MIMIKLLTVFPTFAHYLNKLKDAIKRTGNHQT